VLPAAQANKPLPPNQSASDLQAYIAQLENPASQPVAPLPDMAKRISAQPYQITESPGPYFEELIFTFAEGQHFYQVEAILSGTRYEVQGRLDDHFYVNEVASADQVIALKGYWQDEKTFVQTVKDFAYMEAVTEKYIFEGNRLTLNFNSPAGDSIQILGEMIETKETNP